jgi:acyl-CoA synthetase (NDP forming)
MVPSSLENFFNCKSIAVVGASNTKGKIGYDVLNNIINAGFKGEIYPINLKAEEIMGLKCYKKLTDIDGNIDLMVLIVPSNSIPAIMEQAGQKGIRAGVIISGGFREAGNLELEQEVLNIARKHSIRLLGPNCQGLSYTPNKLCASWPLINTEGSMGVISQSGTVAAQIGIWAQEEGLGVSSIVSLGNKVDVNEIDLIDYYDSDNKTEVISLYIEGVGDGRKFIDTLKKCHKPVVILKPGRTKEGRKAVVTHTDSIAGFSEVFEGICRQYGFINAHNIRELYDFSKAFAYMKRPSGNKVLIITSSGGSGALATDECIEAGLCMANLSAEVKQELKVNLPGHCVINNPFDLTGDANAPMYKYVIESVAKEDIDIIYVIFGDPLPEVAEIIIDLKQKVRQELVICYLGGGDVQKRETLKMHKNGIPVFPTPERAAAVLKKLLNYKKGDIHG